MPALSLDRDNSAAHDLLARANLTEGRDCRARDHLRSLVTVKPDDPDIRIRLALAEYGAGGFSETIRILGGLIEEGLASRELHSEYVSALLYDLR
jgi:Flp pilus assembly protein TadD